MQGPRVRSIPKARLRQKETPIVSAILKTLQLKGYWAWRVNSSLTVLPKQGGFARRVVKGAPAGSPDILLILQRDVLVPRHGEVGFDAALVGQLAGIEVKSPTGKQSTTQRVWQAKAEKNGVRYGVATSVSEALDLVRKWSGA